MHATLSHQLQAKLTHTLFAASQCTRLSALFAALLGYIAISGLGFAAAEKSAQGQPSLPTFLYLLQCAAERDTAELEGEDRAVLQLVYAPKSQRAFRNTTFEFLNSSWNEGRNALLERAKATYQHQLPLYLIFMDCDARLIEVRDFGHNTGQPYRTFESYLQRYLPALGHAHFDWQPYDEDVEIMGGVGNFDAIVNAFHRDAVDALLPYATHWDRHSWHYSQLVVHTITSALFPNHRLQFNALRVQQRPGHASYPRGSMWEVPFLWILPLFRNRNRVRCLPVHHINLEMEPGVKYAALVRNVHPLLAVVNRLPRPSSLPHPLSARLPGIAWWLNRTLPQAQSPAAISSFTPPNLSLAATAEFDFCHPYWRHRLQDGGISSCSTRDVGEGDARGTGPWVPWGQNEGVGRGGGGGEAGTEPAQDWLRGLPLLLSEKEALRAAYMGGAALQDWSCPPMRVSFSIYDLERRFVSTAGEAEVGTGHPGRRETLVDCISRAPSRWDCWHDLALESIRAGHVGNEISGGSGRAEKQVAMESAAMLRTAFRLLGGVSRNAPCPPQHPQGHNASIALLEHQARASVSQHLSLVLDELGAKYGALFHAALAATSAEDCGGDQEDETGSKPRANRWLNLASMCKEMCLYRCTIKALDAYLSSACTALRCKGSYVRTAAVESWNLVQRAGALGSLLSANTYRARFQLLHLSIKHLASRCRSRLAEVHGSNNGGVHGDVPLVDSADVLSMPLDLDVVEEFARCEAEKVLESVGAAKHNSPFKHVVDIDVGLSARASRGQRGHVRVGYVTVIDACRVHNSMCRALFDAEVAGHRSSQAFSFVWRTHMIEKRAGYASPPACARASSSTVEVSPDMSVQEVAALVNSHHIHVLVDMWGWAPLGRSVRSLDLLSLRPASVTAVMLGSLNAPSGGLADFVISDCIVSPPEFSLTLGKGQYSEKRGLLPAPFAPNSHNPLMPVAPWEGAGAAVGQKQREDIRGAHGWPRGDAGVGGAGGGRKRGIVMMASAQLFALDPVLCDIWLLLLREVPDLVLALTANAYAFLGMEAIAKRAKDLHVPEAKIMWHQRVLEDEAYVQRLSAADMTLDTTWHNSLGTVLDSLWASTPVVSLASERPSSRVAASLMTSAGAHLALARNLDDYKAIAGALVHLTGFADKQRVLRRRLAGARSSVLFNSSLWVARWESWLSLVVDLTLHTHTRGTGPRPFHLIASDTGGAGRRR